MRKVTLVESLTLDGVMQARGGKDEDRRGGFERGGWAAPYVDEVLLKEMAKDMGHVELLFGRRTYEQFHAFWPNQPEPNPFTEVLNETPKYVASRTLAEPLPWVNSTLLSGEAVDTVRELKGQPGKDLVVLGSGDLVRSLMAHDLVDEYRLLIHPLVLGTGRRMFADPGPAIDLRLVQTVTTTTGVVIASYRPETAVPAS